MICHFKLQDMRHLTRRLVDIVSKAIPIFKGLDLRSTIKFA